MKWTKSGFENFQKGTFGNGGQNIYVSAKGTLQRIFNYDINNDGFTDLPIANSHSMNELPPIHIYDEIGQKQPLKLPTNGSFDAIFTDLNGNGCDDLVVACQHNGVNNDVFAVIYFGSEIGLSEKYRLELNVPNSLGVTVGDFKNCGKKSLAFISGKSIRIFDQNNNCIERSEFTDFDIAAMSVSSADLDGDGYDDLLVMNQGEGTLSVYWGGKDGINIDRKTTYGKPSVMDDSRANATTPGRKLYRWVPWKCNTLDLGKKILTFRTEDNYAVFESFGKDRKPVEEFRIKCTDAVKDNSELDKLEALFTGTGPMHAVSGDLRGDGSHDIVIAVATDFNAIDDIIVLWESDGYDLSKATRIPIRAARNLSIGKMEENGKNFLFVCQACTDNDLDIETAVFSFNPDKTAKEEWLIPCHEPVSIISGKTYEDGRYQLAVINHEGEKKLGFENVYIFLGGEDGYNGERRLEFPGCAAVDTLMCDFDDDGNSDVLVVNCAENAPTRTPGSTIYFNSDKGFDVINNKIHLNAECADGAAIGDFRKCGYLDIAMGGLSCREIRIFEGGPNGYDFENPKKLVMGPDPEKYLEEAAHLPRTTRIRTFSDEIRKNWSNIRWMTAADFNGDGYLDIFVSVLTSRRSLIFWGGPDGFKADNYQEIATDGIASANAADLNGNGYLDLVLSCHQSLEFPLPKEKGKIVIYWGGPNGYEEHRKTELPTACANALTIQDFNGDGLLDIYATAYGNERCRDIDSKMYFQSEDRMFHIDNYQEIFNHSGCGCLAGDFNNDGYIDLLVASHKAYGNHVCDSYIFWGGEDGINETRYTTLPCRGPHGTSTIDIGNIMDRSDSEYYYSEGYKVPEGQKAVKASWQAANGKSTWVKIQLRCADTLDALESASWSQSFDNNADISALNLKGYIQYKLELGARCGAGTPRVTEVTIDFE